MVIAAQAATSRRAANGLQKLKEESMSVRQALLRKGRGQHQLILPAMRQAIHSLMERLEERRMLAGDVRLVGITGNQQSSDPLYAGLDETLYDIKYGSAGTSDPTFMDGFEDITTNPPDTVLTISNTIGVTEGHGALRVEVDNGVNAFWGIRSGNVIDSILAGATTFSYDLTLTNIELNGGAFGGGTDNSFNGYAQNNELAVVINTPTNGFIQRNFTTGNASDSLGTNATWAGVDGTRTITWDLNTFTSEGMTLQEFITSHNATDARFWIVTQGADTNGHVGPMRFYFDNFQLFGNFGTTRFADFELVSISKIIQLPAVPDTDSIGYNPETRLLHRLSGADSYRNDPNRIGYHDNQFMETIDMNDPVNSQVGVFNANYEGESDRGTPTGNYGLPGPFPTFVFPDHRRLDTETDPSFGEAGPNEYHSLRDLTWSNSEHLFYGADEQGIYRLTADGQSTFVAYPAGVTEPKGITFYTYQGARRLLLSERDGPNLWTIDPATGQPVGDAVVMLNELQFPLPGVLSLVEDPTSNMLLGIAKPVGDSGNPFARELIRIDPATGQTTSLGSFGLHMADLAFIVSPPSVTSSSFEYENLPQRLVFSFTQNVGDSITAADLKLEKLGPGGGVIPVGDPTYDIYSNTVTFPIPGILADGNYKATLMASGVTNTLEMPITANEEVSFFWLNGDLNRDRSVSISDFIDLASKFGNPATKWSDGDLNYDGTVSISDFIDLASNFGKTLDPPAAAQAPAAESLTVQSSSAETLDSDADTAVVAREKSATLFSRTASRKHSHHRRHGHKAAPRRWISHGGAY
jgi:hypothetical protein